MKLNDRTRRILENFSQIEPNIRFVPGHVIATMTPGKSIVAQARVEDPVESEFAISDLARFLGVARLFVDPELKVKDGRVYLSEGGKRASYTCTRLDLPNAPPPPLVKEVTFKPSASFKLPAGVLKQVRDAGSVLKVDDVVILGEKGELKIEATSVNEPTCDKYGLVVGETDQIFRLVFDKNNIKVITADYDVDVSFKGYMRMRAAEDLTYYVTADNKKSVTP